MELMLMQRRSFYIEFLISRKFHIYDFFGATPLHYAALKKNVLNVEILFENGADLSAKDNGII